jgi:cell division protein FtsL
MNALRDRVRGLLGADRPSARRKRQGRSGDVVFTAVAVVVVFGSLLGIVVVQTFIVQNRVQLDSVNRELSVEREQNQQLRLEVIELEAPERILDTAVTRLGMSRPDERTYLPGIDPDLVNIRTPPAGDPFGPAPLPESLEKGR